MKSAKKALRSGVTIFKPNDTVMIKAFKQDALQRNNCFYSCDTSSSSYFVAVDRGLPGMHQTLKLDFILWLLQDHVWRIIAWHGRGAPGHGGVCVTAVMSTALALSNNTSNMALQNEA